MRRIVKSAIIMTIVIGTIYSNDIWIYAQETANKAINRHSNVPEWAIIVGIVVAIINVIVFVCKMGDDGGSWKRQAFHQQQVQQQQEQNRLFQEECERQGREFQNHQWDFQNQQFQNQWQDFNQFNNFNP